MGTIHVNTDIMYQLGALFVTLNEQIASQLEPQIARHVAALEADWAGISRQRFESLLADWRATTARLITNGEELGRHLEDTAQRFEAADNS